MTDIDVRIDATALDRVINTIGERLGFVSPLMVRAGLRAQEEFDEQFATRGHGRWAALEANTQAIRKRLGFPLNDILQRTGALRDSFTRRGAPGSVWQESVDGIEVGSNLPYASLHQTGGERDGRQVPARPVVVVSDELTEDVGRAAAEHIQEGL